MLQVERDEVAVRALPGGVGLRQSVLLGLVTVQLPPAAAHKVALRTAVIALLGLDPGAPPPGEPVFVVLILALHQVHRL